MNFLNRSKPKKEKLTIINQDKELAQLKSEQMAVCTANGKSIAANTTLDASTNLNEMPAVCQTKGAYESKNSAISAIYEQNLSHDQTHYNFLVNDFETNTEYNSVHTDFEKIQAEEKEALDEAITCHDEDIDDKKQEIEDNKDDISNNKTAVKNCKKHNTNLRNGIAVAIMLLIMSGEIYFNQEVFLYLGINEENAPFIGFSLAISMLALGISKAYVIRQPNWSKLTKFILSAISLGIVMFGYYSLGEIRVKFLNSLENEDGIIQMSPIFFMALNTIFYLAIFGTKYFIFAPPEQMKENAEHRIAKKELTNSEKQEKALKAKVANSYKTKQDIFKKVKKPFIIQLKPLLAKLDTKIDTIKNAALDFNTELSRAVNFYGQINADYHECVACFIFNINVSGKKDNVQILMSNLDGLTNPFSKYEPISIEKIEALRIPLASTDKINRTNGTPEPEQSAWEVLAEAQTDDTNYSFINEKKSKS